MTRNCKECNATFEASDDAFYSMLGKYCPKCFEAQMQANKERREAREKEDEVRRKREHEERWRRLCPVAYQDTAIEKLPHPARAREILAWEYGPVGWLLHGPTRGGKTRCAWLLVRKAFDANQSIEVLDSLAGFEYGAEFAISAREVKEWVRDRCRCGLLVLDDVFKAKLTDSFEAAVFAIVDYRLAHRLPIVATLNDTGGTLAARLSSDRGDALVARLKEMCQVIQF